MFTTQEIRFWKNKRLCGNEATWKIHGNEGNKYTRAVVPVGGAGETTVR